METIQDKIVDQIEPEGESVIQKVSGVYTASRETDRLKDKIDPKKLVLYSEIMKTKF